MININNLKELRRVENNGVIQNNLNNQPITLAFPIDLGLPSGTRWADRNVGATSPTDGGLYFSWGNVSGVHYGETCDFSREAYVESAGADISMDILPDGGHDAARENMGMLWHMPTKEDFLELYKNCSHMWAKRDGVNGLLFTSKINGNSIFLPASGNGHYSSWAGRDDYGLYWLASFISSGLAQDVMLCDEIVDMQSPGSRYFGCAVRAVQKYNPEKFFTNNQFDAEKYYYSFTLYSSQSNADTDTNAHPIMEWHNNDLTRAKAKLILMGIASAAKIKYKHAVAVLYAVTPDGHKRLDSCA